MDLTTIFLPKIESELESRPLHFPFTPPLDYEEIVRYNTWWLLVNQTRSLESWEGKWEGLPENSFLFVKMMLSEHFHKADKNMSYHLSLLGNPDTWHHIALGEAFFLLDSSHSSLWRQESLPYRIVQAFLPFRVFYLLSPYWFDILSLRRRYYVGSHKHNSIPFWKRKRFNLLFHLALKNLENQIFYTK